jgi:hypothetical protein
MAKGISPQFYWQHWNDCHINFCDSVIVFILRENFPQQKGNIP